MSGLAPAVSNTLASSSAGLISLPDSVKAAATASGFHTVGRNLAEHVSEQAEHVDFFSENSIGACVTCCVSLCIWLVFLPIFHLAAVPWMAGWEAMHAITLNEYMGRAKETYESPRLCFHILDQDGDGNATKAEFLKGSELFRSPPFQYPADSYPIFNQLDANMDGLIQRQEFYNAAPSRLDSKWNLDMKDLKDRARQGYGFLDSYYTAMDVDTNGKVTLDEWMKMAVQLTPPVSEIDGKLLFTKADTDGSGFIEPREWVSYTVSGTVTFDNVLPPGVDPAGSQAKVAVEAGLRASLHILENDLVTISEVQDVTRTDDYASTTTAPGGGMLHRLKATVKVLVGTKARQTQMQQQLKNLPNNFFSQAFEGAIAGGSTTLPIGPPSMKPVKDGPVTADELKAYMDVPAVVQGRTELRLSHASAGTNSVEKQEKALAPLFKQTLVDFCSCEVSIESVQTTVMQDLTGSGRPTNKSMIILWSSDVKHGGTFEKNIEDDGRTLVANMYSNIMQENLPCMVGVKLDSWTRFSATYYGQQAASLPRGSNLKQRFGHFLDQDFNMRNDTCTRPFVGSFANLNKAKKTTI